MTRNARKTLRSVSWLMRLLLFAPCLLASGWCDTAETDANIYYDVGVFLYEAGDYENSESYLRLALTFSPEHPYTYHYLGKIDAARDRKAAAKENYGKALAIDPDIAGLRFDIGLLLFQSDQHAEAAEHFLAAVDRDPEDPAALYYAGLSLAKSGQCDDAADVVERAAAISPSVRSSGMLAVGVCRRQSGADEAAADIFKTLRETEASEPVRRAAGAWGDAWLRATSPDAARKSWSLDADISRFHDDNVRAAPDDIDIGADGSDGGTELRAKATLRDPWNRPFRLFGSADIVSIRHDSLSEFDQTATWLTLRPSYRLKDFTVGMAYSFSSYWLDGDDALRVHELAPYGEIYWGRTWRARFSYSLDLEGDLLDEARDGEKHTVEGRLFYNLPGGLGMAHAGLRFEKKDAETGLESFQRLGGRIGASLALPGEVQLKLDLAYADKKYETDDPALGAARNDDKYSARFSASRHIFYEWLRFGATYNFTRNDSNFRSREYTRNRFMITVSADF